MNDPTTELAGTVPLEMVSASPATPAAVRLNLGCGKDILSGWINIDRRQEPGVDHVLDLDCHIAPLPFADQSVDEFFLCHVLEHISDPLALMAECWRVAKHGARMVIRCPYGSSDEAWSDPTHVRPYFLSSFECFSQPYYWRTDYGYRGDWLAASVILVVDGNRFGADDWTDEEVFEAVRDRRNIVAEMIVELRAVHPARPAERSEMLRVAVKVERI